MPNTEKTIDKPNDRPALRPREHKLTLLNRRDLSITGLESVLSVNSSMLVLKLQGTELIISGADLHVTKLDVEQGIIEIDGLVDSIKYSGERQKLSLFKRLFK